MLLLPLMACGGSQAGVQPHPSPTLTYSASPTPSTSPTPNTSSGSLGVVVIESDASPSTSYFVAIIGLDGRIRASARASEPTALRPWPPLVSVAGSHVFYLDGDRKLMRLDLDGSTAQVASLPGGPADRVVVAVDPGSGRIAFGVAHIGPNTCPSPPTQPCYPPISTQLWVAAADGSGARTLPIHRFPVAWHAGRIVVGPAGGFLQNPGWVNPYLADSLELVDPATGQTTNMTASCSSPGDSLTGPLVPAGIACQHFSSSASSLTALSWDGHESVLASPLPPNSLPAALSPDGTRAAISDNGPINGTPNVDLAQNGKLTSLHVSAAPVGWLDPIHLLVNTTSQQASSQGFEILDVANGSVVKIDLAGNGGYVASYGAYFASFPSD